MKTNNSNNSTMKDFVAIYDTATITNAKYSFGATSMEEAIEKAQKLISSENIRVFETDGMGAIIIENFKDIAIVTSPRDYERKTFGAYIILDGRKIYVGHLNDNNDYSAWDNSDLNNCIGHIYNVNGKAVVI